MHEGMKERYFIVKPETKQCKVKLRTFNNVVLDKIKIPYLPITSSISTTGHKLQGKTLDNLVINSWGYRCTHWVYVVLSRVRTLRSLILNVKLDEHRDYSAKEELLRWEKDMKANIESESFRLRGQSVYERYIKEEEQYNCK